MELTLSDPTYSPPATGSRVERVAERFIHDRRDVPFLKLMALTTLTVVPSGLVLFVPGQFRWWLAGVHLALVIYFLGPFVLMAAQYQPSPPPSSACVEQMNQYIPWAFPRSALRRVTGDTYFSPTTGRCTTPRTPRGRSQLHHDLPCARQRAGFRALHFLRFFVMALPELSSPSRKQSPIVSARSAAAPAS